MAEVGYTGQQAMRVAGISYRQLDYWARTGLVRPELHDADGSGTRRVYSYRDLLTLRAIKKLLDGGIKLQYIREVKDALHELGEDLATANLVVTGTRSVTVVRSDSELIDVLRQGQGVLNIVLPLAGVKDEVDRSIVSINPGAEGDVAAVAGGTPG